MALNLAMNVLPSPNQNNTTAGIWNKTLEHYSKYEESQLLADTRKLGLIVRNAPVSKLQAVYNKYKNSKHYKISTHESLTSSLDTFLAWAAAQPEQP